jgi:hypothetical protein
VHFVISEYHWRASFSVSITQTGKTPFLF